jgi:hypothetical protein
MSTTVYIGSCINERNGEVSPMERYSVTMAFPKEDVDRFDSIRAHH